MSGPIDLSNFLKSEPDSVTKQKVIATGLALSDLPGSVTESQLPSSAVTESAPKVASAYLTPSGGDDSAAMVSALTNFAPYVSPHVVLGPGLFKWSADIPAFARSLAARVQGSGVGRTTIQLSSAAPRAFDFNKVADYDTFSDIEISDLTIDCNNVGGRHHVVIGNYANATQTTKINVSRLAIRRVRTINVPTDSTTTNHRLNVFLVPVVNSTDTACTLNDIVLEDCDFTSGGNIGVSIGGSGTGGGNLSWDRIYLTRVKHDTGQVNNSTTYSSENIQIGSTDTGGFVSIRDCYGGNSGDVGISVINARHAVVDGCDVLDAHTGAYQAVNLTSVSTAGQTARFDNCASRVVNLQPNATNIAGTGFYMDGASVTAYGTVTLRDCSYTTTAPQFTAAGLALKSSNANGIAKLSVDGFAINGTIADTSTGSTFPSLINLALGGTSRVELRKLKLALSGSTTNASMQRSLAKIAAKSGGTLTLVVDGIEVGDSITGGTNPYQILVGSGASGGTMQGSIRRVTIPAGATFTAANVVYVGPTSSYSTMKALSIEDCDFTQLAGGGKITVDATQAAAVTVRHNGGYNPVGSVTVTVPASGTAVAAQPYDRTFYVTAGASTCTMAIQNGPSPVIPASGFGTIRVPAGKTVTPTYTAAPSWVVEGE